MKKIELVIPHNFYLFHLTFQIWALRSQLVDHVHQHDALQGGHAGSQVGRDLQGTRDLHVQRTKAASNGLGKES